MKCKRCFAKFSDEETACPTCGIPADKQVQVVAPQDVPRVAPPRRCIAYGCPLAGTWNPMIYGDNPNWLCFIHSEAHGPNWQNATATINRKLPELRKIKDDYAFRSAMRDAVAGKEVSRKYWESDGMTRNHYTDSIRKAHAARTGGGPVKVAEHIARIPGSDDDLPLGIARDPLEEEFADRANP